MFDGVNDSMVHAREIVRLTAGLECRVNLIRFHTIPDVDLKGSDMSRMESFRDYLTAHGVFTTIRASRGQDIFAACGLLTTAKKMGEGRSGAPSEASVQSVFSFLMLLFLITSLAAVRMFLVER